MSGAEARGVLPADGKGFGKDAEERFKGLGNMSPETEGRYFGTRRGNKKGEGIIS